MAGNSEQQETDNCAFQWDESSQLYYHASTGFYYDPKVGWYYSSVDGLYYKYEDGSYVLLHSNQGLGMNFSESYPAEYPFLVKKLYVYPVEKRTQERKRSAFDKNIVGMFHRTPPLLFRRYPPRIRFRLWPLHNEILFGEDESEIYPINSQSAHHGSQAGDQPEIHDSNNDNCQGEASEAQMEGNGVSVDPSLDSSACASDNQSEYPPPPSEWLEDTLIDMFLSGYSNQTTDAAPSETAMHVEADGTDQLKVPMHGDDGDDEEEELEEGEWVPDDPDFWQNLSDKVLDEGVSEEEENWRAQYGQAIQLYEDWMLDLQTVDLWDWALVKGKKKDGQIEVARLVGRLRKRSSKLHPSVPSGGGILKTAPVCEVHLDMVRVTSGRIYRLRIPILQYLASLSFYDASNPTKDWGFPRLSIKNPTDKLPKYDQQSESQTLEGLGVGEEKSLSSAKPRPSKKDNIYRDRAAERRALHGGYGVGPGQKKVGGPDSVPSSPDLLPEDAAAESLNISFGDGSYAKKILQGMGWKEGEALGCSTKGLTEPLEATGNKGTAGLGWANGMRK